MNAGMFGQPGGTAYGANRSLLTFGSQIETVGIDTAALRTGIRGVRVTGAAAAAGVRTRLYAAVGKGACRFFALSHSGAGAQNMTIDLVIDGVTVQSKALTSVGNESSPTSIMVAGFFTVAPYQSIRDDYLQFNASFEVYVTQASSYSLNYVYNVDAHQ